MGSGRIIGGGGSHRNTADVVNGSLKVSGPGVSEPLSWLQTHYSGSAVVLGTVPGISGVHKFGANLDVDTATVPETIWPTGGLYPFQDAIYAAEVLSSDNVADVAAGTGARTVRIEGLITAACLEFSETITLTGTTPVPTLTTDWRRINRVFVATAGSSHVNAGTITVRLVGAGDIQATIEPTLSQSQLGVFTVPGGKKATILTWDGQLLSAGGTNETVLGLFTKSNLVADSATRLRAQLAMGASGSSSHLFPFFIPILVATGGTDIEVRVLATNTNNVSVATALGILLINETVLVPS